MEWEKRSIERLKEFEPIEGYWLGFSGGKDSQCIHQLCVDAGVLFEAHYNLTTIDPPELVRFIKEKYPSVIIDYPERSFLKIIEKKGLPTRLKRWCCEELKERGGEGRLCVLGIRNEESQQRKERRMMELVTRKQKDKMLFSDDDEGRRMFENCMVKGKRVLNPIIDWTESDVWQYLNSKHLEHCELYDQGYKRLGCIGCPMAGKKQRVADFERYPKYYNAIKKACDRFLVGYFERAEKQGRTPYFRNSDEMMKWWIYEVKIKRKEDDDYDYTTNTTKED